MRNISIAILISVLLISLSACSSPANVGTQATAAAEKNNNYVIAGYDYDSLYEFWKKADAEKYNDFTLGFENLSDLILKVEKVGTEHKISKINYKAQAVDCNIKFYVANGGVAIHKTEDLLAVGYQNYYGYYYIFSDTEYKLVGDNSVIGEDGMVNVLEGAPTISLKIEEGKMLYEECFIKLKDRISLIQSAPSLVTYLNSVGDLYKDYIAEGEISLLDGKINMQETLRKNIKNFYGDYYLEEIFSSEVLNQTQGYTNYINYLNSKWKSAAGSSISSYNTKELSRNENYKMMEMYVYDEKWTCSRKITFEIPVDWRGKSSVFTNDEDYKYTLKVDMVNVLSTTRDELISEINGERNTYKFLSENIYSTENYEVFNYKTISNMREDCYIYTYYLYANGERFCLTSYVFGEEKPEYDSIIKRIVESVKFQF